MKVKNPYLHCPLRVSQLVSVETTPGREQLQISQPTSGWQPNAWGSHSMHSGRSVLGGQIQSPVTGSHNLVPQLQAAEQRYSSINQKDLEEGKFFEDISPLVPKASFVQYFRTKNVLS